MARWDKEDTSTIPDWFWEAVDTPAESRTIEVDECDVAYRFYPCLLYTSPSPRDNR